MVLPSIVMVQALVMAFSILFTNLYELHLGGTLDHPHAFSLMLIIPFIGTTLALLRHNWCVAARVAVWAPFFLSS